MKVKRTMLTTSDNPFDPFEDYSNWDKWDKAHGYYTMNYLLRVARLSDSLTPQEEADEIAYAAKTICSLFPTSNYKIVRKEVDEEMDTL